MLSEGGAMVLYVFAPDPTEPRDDLLRPDDLQYVRLCKNAQQYDQDRNSDYDYDIDVQAVHLTAITRSLLQRLQQQCVQDILDSCDKGA